MLACQFCDVDQLLFTRLAPDQIALRDSGKPRVSIVGSEIPAADSGFDNRPAATDDASQAAGSAKHAERNRAVQTQREALQADRTVDVQIGRAILEGELLVGPQRELTDIDHVGLGIRAVVSDAGEAPAEKVIE